MSTQPTDLAERYDVPQTINFILHGGYRNVALQFPDDLLADSPAVCHLLQQQLDKKARVFILADTAYNPLGVDEVAAQHLAADCVIHYGRASMVPVHSLPAFFVLPKEPYDVLTTAQTVRQAVHEAVRSRAASGASNGDSSCAASNGGCGGYRCVVVLLDQGFQYRLSELQAAMVAGGGREGGEETSPLQPLIFAHVTAGSLLPQTLPRSRTTTTANTPATTATTTTNTATAPTCCATPSSCCAAPTAAPPPPAGPLGGLSEASGAGAPCCQYRGDQGTCAQEGTSGCQSSPPPPLPPSQQQQQEQQLQHDLSQQPRAFPLVEGCNGRKVVVAEGGRGDAKPGTPTSQAAVGPADAAKQGVSVAAQNNAADNTGISDSSSSSTPTDSSPQDASTTSCSSNSNSTNSSTINMAGLTWQLPTGVARTHCLYVWLGPEGSGAQRVLQLTHAACDWLSYDPTAPYDGVRQGLSDESRRLLKRRNYMVEKVRAANIVGLLVGTLGSGGFLDVISALRRLAVAAGKKTYTFLMGKPNPAKLGNFPEVDVFVLVADGVGLILDSREYLAPLVTPWEAAVAFSGGHLDPGDYRMELRDVLDFERQLHQPQQQAEQPGALRVLSGDPGLSLATRGSVGQWGDIVARNAAEYLAMKRSFRGLEMPATGASPKAPELAVEGLSGRAAVYADEGAQVAGKAAAAW